LAIIAINGRVLASVVANKAIFSTSNQAGVFNYVASDKITELETGVTDNVPRHLALKQAAESTVYSLIITGSQDET
jgi:hypothetical protein